MSTENQKVKNVYQQNDKHIINQNDKTIHQKEDFCHSKIKAEQINTSVCNNFYESQIDHVTLHYKEVLRLNQDSEKWRLRLVEANQELAEMKRERKIFFNVLKSMGVFDRVFKTVALKMYEKKVQYKIKEENEIEVLETA